jgi:DNA (cytosine-5)-methyltransferase 1
VAVIESPEDTEASTPTLAEAYEFRDGRIHKAITTPAGVVNLSRPANSETENLRSSWLRGFLDGSRVKLAGDRQPSVRTAELFCGPGGLGLGFSEACKELGTKMESEAAVDQDEGAVSVYAANHQTKIRSVMSASELVDRPIIGRGIEARFSQDPMIIEETWAPLIGKVDAVLAGPPCQGHSNLNNHSRRTDKRNELYLTVPSIAIALGADIVIIENVPAVVHDSSKVVATAEMLLREGGYEVETGVFSASKMGWPQTRQRFFMIARRSKAPLPVAEVQGALEEQARSVMWAIRDLADAPHDEKLHILAELSEENRRRIDFLFDNDLHNLPPSERPECHQEGTTYNAVYGRMFADRPAPTLTTGFLTPGRGRYIHPELRRTLTPHEAARIQGFPDTYNFFPDAKNPPTKAKLTKWIGDAVPMPLGFAAGLSALGNGWSREI